MDATLTNAIPIPLRLTGRAEALYRNDLDIGRRYTDRIMCGLMVLQWLFGIIAALVISPQTWIGTYSQTNIHVYAAVFLGGALTGLPIYMARYFPGEVITRHCMAVCQMLWSALLIHLTGGRIETHFHVFGSLAFLAFYRDWRVLITATLVVGLDHLIRGVFWPISVFGVTTASNWRWLEHVAWVAFEDVVLVVSCLRGNHELRGIAVRQAEIEKAKEELTLTGQDLRFEMAERQRAAESSVASQLLLRGIIDNSYAVIYVKDVEGRYQMVNRRYTELFHIEDEAIRGKTDYDLFPRDIAERLRAVDERVASTEIAITEEEVVPHDDGLHTYVSVKCPLWDSAGKPYAVFGISTDISDRKNAEIKLTAQLERLDLLHQITRAIGERQDLKSIFQVVVRSLEERLPIDFCCVCLYDREENLLVVSSVGVKSASTANELAMTELAKIPIDENGLSRCVRGHLVYEPDITDVQFPFPQRLARGGLRSVVIAPLLVESQVFGVLVAARREANGFSSGDCEFLKHLSEHVALAAHQADLHTALLQAYDDLRQSQQTIMQQERLRALGQMASGIAHDINNAISPVALYTESLLENEPNLSVRARGYLEIISRAIEDVAATVARMREFYRQREPQLILAPVDLSRLVQEVIDLTRARWSDMPMQRGVVIEPKLALLPDLPSILGIESEIREVLTNLIINAVDAMPDGGSLTVRTRVGDSAASSDVPAGQCLVYVEVIDTGLGMDEDTQRRCLEPFFTTKGERGTGLGLAMVYGVIQRHRANIEIESLVGAGTTVRVIFAAPPKESGAPRQTSSAPTIISPIRILIVDDDPLLLMSLRDTLEIDGHAVVVANGGQAGIDVFVDANERGEAFPIVITDLGMPSVDGRKVAHAVKDAVPTTAVIMLTGWGQRLVADGDVPPQVACVLNKPPKLRELREALVRCRPEVEE